VSAAYILRTGDEWMPPDGNIAFKLDLLINGEVALPDPHGPGDDVFEVAGQRFRPVRWDLDNQALICWRVP
jgi:hypothetical protein